MGPAVFVMNHLELAHSFWEEVLQEGDNVIDATCGNGKDTLRLARLSVGRSVCSQLIGLDIQERALERTRERLMEGLTVGELGRIHLYQQSHAIFPPLAYELPIRLVVYNLGYLPGGDKGVTTRVETTLRSLEAARDLVQAGGLITVTCYPGHPEGAREEEAVGRALQGLAGFDIHHRTWTMRPRSPSLFILRKSK